MFSLKFCTVAVAMALLLWLFIKRPRAGIVLLLLPELIDVITRNHSPSLTVAGVRIAMADVLLVCLAVATAKRVTERGMLLGRGVGPLAGLFVLVSVALWHGIGMFGLQIATNEARQYLYFLVAALYVATLGSNIDLPAFFAKTWIVFAIAYTCIAIPRWATTGLGTANEYTTFDGSIIGTRPLTSEAALLIAQAALVLIVLRPIRRNGLVATGLFGVVVLLQHRSVWAATVVAVIAYLLLERGPSAKRVAVGLAGIWFALLAFLTGSILSFGPAATDLAASVGSISGQHSTLAWRVAGWKALLGGQRNPVEWAFGQPFGTGFARVVGKSVIAVSPHNFYVQTLLRVGLVGLVLLLAVLLMTFSRVSAKRGTGLLVRLILITQFVYLMPYSPTTTQGVALGLAVWYVRHQPGRRRHRLLEHERLAPQDELVAASGPLAEAHLVGAAAAESSR